MGEELSCVAKCGSPLNLDHTVKIITVCPNGHKMHAECVSKTFEYSDDPTCPVCRDDTLSILRQMIINNPEGRGTHADDSDDEDSGGEDAIPIQNTNNTYTYNYTYNFDNSTLNIGRN
jgi:hypothetical protein